MKIKKTKIAVIGESLTSELVDGTISVHDLLEDPEEISTVENAIETLKKLEKKVEDSNTVDYI